MKSASDCYSVIKSQKPKSLYRGLSKNGKNWQVLIMSEKRKTYIGTYGSEKEAAKTYDKYSILINGISAKPNFSYTKEEVENILALAYQ